MRARKTQRESRSNLSADFVKRLNMYSLAASAAGLSLLTFSETSGAKVVFTPAQEVIPPETSFFLDLKHDRIGDFGFFIRTDQLTSALSVYGYGKNQAFGPASGRFASALPAGVRVGPSNQKRPLASLEMAYWKCSSNPFSSCAPFRTGGQFANVNERFLGLKFFIGGKVHFGWARFDVSTKRNQNNRGTLTVTLTGYAYETVPNKAIITGETSGPDVITLPPATLGHLARGASAISAWRKAQ